MDRLESIIPHRGIWAGGPKGDQGGVSGVSTSSHSRAGRPWPQDVAAKVTLCRSLVERGRTVLPKAGPNFSRSREEFRGWERARLADDDAIRSLQDDILEGLVQAVVSNPALHNSAGNRSGAGARRRTLRQNTTIAGELRGRRPHHFGEFSFSFVGPLQSFIVYAPFNE